MVLCSTAHILQEKIKLTRKDKAESYVKKLVSIMNE